MEARTYMYKTNKFLFIIVIIIVRLSCYRVRTGIEKLTIQPDLGPAGSRNSCTPAYPRPSRPPNGLSRPETYGRPPSVVLMFNGIGVGVGVGNFSIAYAQCTK